MLDFPTKWSTQLSNTRYVVVSEYWERIGLQIVDCVPCNLFVVLEPISDAPLFQVMYDFAMFFESNRDKLFLAARSGTGYSLISLRERFHEILRSWTS